MINLIPPQGRAALRHEYLLRIGSVGAFLLSGAFLIGAVLLAPTYVLTSSQVTGARGQSSEMEETKRAFDSAFGEIRVANTIMAQLRKTDTLTPITKTLEEAVRVAPPGIRFNGFSLDRKNGGLSQIVIQGVADTRRTLASFKTTLEASDTFEEAVIPISDLARETELPFAITVTLSSGEKEPSP